MKTCEKCQILKPLTNFNKVCSGNRRLSDGSISQHDYRTNICRKCQRAEMLNANLCKCSRPLTSGKKSCGVCRESGRIRALARHKQDRQTAIKHYGGGCVFCGETLEIFLTIDHINDDGASHREHELRNKKTKNGFSIGAWLRKNQYPEGFQVLCVNCNHAKWRVGGADKLIEILREAGRLSSRLTDSA